MRMRNLRVQNIVGAPFFFFFLFFCVCSAALETPSYNPLLGSPQRYPGSTNFDVSEQGGAYLYHGNPDLTRLLDVGACQFNPDSSISYVPPLDGTASYETLCQDNYAMKIVLFDWQLVQLKSVDPVGGSFRAELQMVLHWVDSMIPGSNGTTTLDICTFPCATASPRPTCCDNVWVPPLVLSRCDINSIKSFTPLPSLFRAPPTNNTMSFYACLENENRGKCIWRRLWYLNIDVTCMSSMDFHDFPFDWQDLTIDLLNPYASRTWFQHTKGFLEMNIHEDINGVNLSPDSKISGWYVNDLTVSSTSGASQTWLQTFLTQDELLSALSNDDSVTESYKSQRDFIIDTLNPKNLTCSVMQDFPLSKTDKNLFGPSNLEAYLSVKEKYEERVNSTLDKYRQCIQDNGKSFLWNKTMVEINSYVHIPGFGWANFSTANINRLFSFLDLDIENKLYKVWFPCAITAVANITTPGIRLTIRVQRYQMFYVVKLILPTLACVAFTFSAFGFQPHDLMGRLTVVVPSAIALTALQGLVVSTDIPPLAYIAPSTYIILISYTTQVLIAFESILIQWLVAQERPKFVQTMYKKIKKRAPFLNKDANIKQSAQGEKDEEQCDLMKAARVFDFLFMGFVGLLYALALMLCTIVPWHHSELAKGNNRSGFISILKTF